MAGSHAPGTAWAKGTRFTVTAQSEGSEVITLLQAHLDAIDHKISSLQSLREAMTGVLHAAAAHADQGDQVPLCQIIGPASSA